MPDTAAISSTSRPGLPTVSPQNSLVLGRTAARQVKQAGGMVAGIEDKGGGEVNWHGARARGAVGCGACVQGQGVKAGVRVAGHGVVSIRKSVSAWGGKNLKSLLPAAQLWAIF